MTVNEKIAGVRELLEQFELDAWITPSTDPHMGEYVPEHWAERAWISGFTGSAGTCVITKDFAGVWTDSRYFVQAEQELANSDMELVKLTIPHTAEHVDYLCKVLPKEARVGVNGKMLSVAGAKHLKMQLASQGMELITLIDLVSKIWTDRPALPDHLIMEHELRFAGQSRCEKIEKIQEEMTALGASHYLVGTLDEVAWTMNLRGTDVPFNPLFVSYLLITLEEAILFIDQAKLEPQLIQVLLGEGIKIAPYSNIYDALARIPIGASLCYDAGKTNQSLLDAVSAGVACKDILGIVTALKSIKNPIEIEGLKNVMLKDGVAWVKFLNWLNRSIGKEEICELSAAKKLESFREEQEHFMGPSFHPISSFGPHGSIVHYAVSEESSIPLKADGIYLCDTGGHYLDGTTDTTRTMSLGNVTAEQKKDFTLALKGTLAVSMLRFPVGTKGYQMDILARKALWEYGLNYGHGTGHGVGFFLNVHEGPQTIGTGATGHMQTSITPGMITTVEPAIYREGSHGMRTENITVCVEDITTEFGSFLRFETITLAPIDRKLIDKQLLEEKEIIWLNNYHKNVFDALNSYLSAEEADWLKEQTQAI